MEEITKTLLELLAIVLALLGIGLGNMLLRYIKSKMSAEDAAMLDQFIDELTSAADQMFKKDDPDGTMRYQYVTNALIDAGYELTEAIVAKIESSVFYLPHKGGDGK